MAALAQLRGRIFDALQPAGELESLVGPETHRAPSLDLRNPLISLPPLTPAARGRIMPAWQVGTGSRLTSLSSGCGAWNARSPSSVAIPTPAWTRPTPGSSRLVDVLTRLVGVVAAQGEKFDRLNERFDRLTEAILEGRTHDTERVTGLERRGTALEQRLRGTPPPGEKA